jgi:hypothetical protein
MSDLTKAWNSFKDNTEVGRAFNYFGGTPVGKVADEMTNPNPVDNVTLNPLNIDGGVYQQGTAVGVDTPAQTTPGRGGINKSTQAPPIIPTTTPSTLAQMAPANNNSQEDQLRQSYLNSLGSNYGFTFNNTNPNQNNRFLGNSNIIKR